MKKMNRFITSGILLVFASLLVTSCVNSESNMAPSDVSEPANIIPIKQAKEMYDEYTNKKVPALKEYGQMNGTVYNPTRYIEYKLEDIKHYIDYIESESARANVDISMLRIYFGAYPNASNFETGGAISFPKQESIFITPTALNARSGEHQAFFTTGKVNSNDREAIFFQGMGKELMNIGGKGKGKKYDKASMLPFIVQDDTTDVKSLVMNRGNVRPPPKKDDDFSSDTNDDNGDEGDKQNKGRN